MEAGQAGPVCRRFSSCEFAEKDRIPFWREVYGQTVVRLDIEPLRDRPFEADLRLRALHGIKLVGGTIGGACDRRTSALMADGNDDLGLAINVSGTSTVTQCGHETSLQAGDGVLMSCGDAGAFVRPLPSRFLGIRVPRTRLKARVPDAEDMIGRPIPRSGVMGLLSSYVDGLLNETASGADMQLLAANHIIDLAALALGAPSAPAQKGGLRAARLSAIKADIAARFSQPSLSLETVAARHGVTPRYVQMLFESEGARFSEFLLSQRLGHARSMLGDPRFFDRPISAIAYDAGFSDLSTFNRAFRRRYGLTPSEARAAGN
jgi:AraC-like DNA-binding protein